MTKKPLHTVLAKKSEDEFTKMYDAYSAGVYRFMFWRTKDAHLSEDLTSGVFEKAWRSRNSFEGGSSQAWLFRIARNTLIDYWRLKKTVPLDDDDSVAATAPETAEIIDSAIQLDVLNKAMQTLAPEMRYLLEMRFIDGLSANQVASKLNTTAGNVRIMQYRALRKLRKELQ